MDQQTLLIRIAGDVSDLVRKMNEAERSVTSTSSVISSSLDGIKNRMLGVAGVFAAGFSVRALAQMADDASMLESRLKLVTNSASQLSQTQQTLFQIAQNARVNFNELGGTFAQIARSTKDMEISQSRLLGVTNTISQAITISGVSAASANAALVQLSQGLASGTLRGEELNSVMEQTPRLAQALADGMGVSIGQLRNLGAEGKVTAEAVINALEKSAASVSAEFSKVTPTIAGATTMATNSLGALVGEMDKATGASAAVAGGIQSVSSGLDSVAKIISENQTTFAVITTTLASGAALAALPALAGGLGLVATAATGLGVALAANPVVLALLGVGAVGGGLWALSNARKSSITGMAEEINNLTQRINEAESTLAKTKGGDALTAQMFARVEAMKKARAELQQQWGGAVGAQSNSTAEDARLARMTAERTTAERAAQKAAEDLMGVRIKLAGVDKDYLTTLTTLQTAREKGLLSQTEYVRLVTELAQKTYKQSDAEKAATQATHALDNKYKEFRGTLQEKLAQQQLEMGTGQKLTESDKLRIQFMALLGDEFKKLSPKRQAEIDGLIHQLALGEEEIKQIKRKQAAYQAFLADQEEQNAAYVADSKAREQGRQAVIDYEQAILEQARATELEISLIGQTEVARRKAMEVYRIELDLKRQIEAINKNTGFDEVQREEQRARARAAAAQAVVNAGNRVFLDEMQKSVDEWQKTTDQINQSLTDALMRGFESGKGFAENLRDTVVNMFKTMVLRPVISAIVNPVAGALTGALAPTAASAGTNALSGAAGSAASSFLFGGASLSAIGSSIGTGFMATLSGQSIGAAASAYTAAGMQGVSAGLQAGAAAPYVMAAVAALAALGAFRTTKQVGSGLAGTLGEGDINSYALMRKSGYLFGGPDYSMQDRGIAEQSAALQTAYQTMRTATAGMATQLGLSADAVVNFTTRLGNDLIHPDTGGYGLKLDGLSQEQIQAKVSEALASANDALAQQILGTWTTATETVTRVITDEAGHWDSGIETVTREITETIEKTAYQASEFAKQGETASQTLARLSGDLGVVNAAFDTLGATLLKGLKGADQASSLVSAFGGQDAFKTATAAYYEAFYSEEEKRSTLTRQVTEALAAQNLVMPATVEAYRALVEAQDLTTASGQAAAAVLVKLGPTFAKTLEGIEDDAKKTAAQVSQYLGPVNDAATQSNETLIKLLDERKSLEADLATAMGGTAAAIALATEGMDEQGKAAWAVNQILKQQIAAQEQINTARDNILSLQRDLMQAQFGDAAVAAFDLAQATKDMTADQRISYVQQVALASAIQRAITIEGQKKSLQEELLSLTETSTEALVRQRAALDESVRGLFDQVQAIRAAKAAEEERKGLTEQYLRATSQTAALRALELAKLDPTNRALQAQIWAYDDLKTVQEKAVAAAERAIAAEQKRQDEIVTGAEKLVDSLGSVFELLSEQVRELYGQTDATKAMLATQGMALIDKAIATGVLPTQKDLTQAITAARAGLDANSYSSKAEFTYAQLTLAGKLSLLRSDAQEQLTTAEQALAVAKQQQETLDAQLDALKGVETGVLSVAQAIAAAVAANAALAAASGSSGATSTASLGAWTGQGGAMWNDTFARAAGDSTLYSADEFRALIAAKVMTAQGAAEVNAGRIEAGMSLEDFDRYMRYAAGTSAAALASLGLPSFDVGANVVPRDMVAQLHAGEAVIPAAFNPWAGGRLPGAGDTDEVQALRAEMRENRAQDRAQALAIVTELRELRKLHKSWNSNGLPATRDDGDTTTVQVLAA